MKTLESHINEALKIGKNISSFSTYSCKPTAIHELKAIINDRICREGAKCDLNDIDVSLITDMSYLFYKTKFNGDISNWDVSNVNNMWAMFYMSKFNGDISKWDVSKVEDMSCMFKDSVFTGDISEWKINKNCDTAGMFYGCPIKEEYKPKILQR